MAKFRMYIDESGNSDIGKSASENNRFLCLTGVIFDLDYVNKIFAPEFEKFKAKFFGFNADNPVILHRKDIMNYRGKFSILKDEKIKKQSSQLSLELERTDDILQYLGNHKKDGQFICGFSMETTDMLENSKKKLERKHVDMIAANNLKVEGAGFGVDTNVLTLITQDGVRDLPMMTKREAAHCLLSEISRRLNENKGQCDTGL